MNIKKSWSSDGRERPYVICSRCIMDTTDPDITFDADGVCNLCRYFDASLKPYWKPDAAGQRELEDLIAMIRKEGEGKPYDCIIGLSGGVDSSFLTTKLIEWGLRPLVVHVDAGWNSELAVRNIEEIITRLGLHLDTEVIDWNEMRDLQRAFLKSHVANQDIPQDHAFAGALVKKALDRDITYVVNGNNLATEGVLPQSWGYDAMDSTHIRAIHRRFGEHPLKTFPLLSFRDYYVTMLQRLKFVSPLNLMPYDKAAAIAYLEKNFGWRYYGGKHYESIWTHWYQAHYLPVKFGYDKRKAHLSSLVVAGSMTRDEALAEMEKPLYTDNALKDDTAFVAKKLGFSIEELEALTAAPPRHYLDFATNAPQLLRHRIVRGLIARMRRYGPAALSLPGRALRKAARMLSARTG
jgi:aminotransferase